MKRTSWSDLVPNILLAIGILTSTWIAVVTAESGWWVLAGPLIMALALVGTTVLGYRWRGASRDTVRVALIMATALLLASAIVALRDPSGVASMLPVLGACIAAPIGIRLSESPYGESKCCKTQST